MLSTQAFDPPMLRQQSLEPRPAKRWARGAECWGGVDPSTKRVSFATVGPGGFRVATRSFNTGLKDGERWEHIRSETAGLVEGLLRDGWTPPAYVLVEEPGGKNVHPSSYYAIGAITAALHSVTGVVVELIPPSSWKLAGLGYGSADKQQIMRWARSVGYEGALEDESDALGIAVACMRMVSVTPLV